MARGRQRLVGRVALEPRLVVGQLQPAVGEPDPVAGPPDDALDREQPALGLAEQRRRSAPRPVVHGRVDEQPVAGADRRQHRPVDDRDPPRAGGPDPER